MDALAGSRSERLQFIHGGIDERTTCRLLTSKSGSTHKREESVDAVLEYIKANPQNLLYLEKFGAAACGKDRRPPKLIACRSELP